MRLALPILLEENAGLVRLNCCLPAVNLREHRLHFRLAEFVLGIPPVERAQWFVDRVVRCFCFRLQAQCKLMNEPRVGATIPGRINGLLAPLQKPLRVGECPFLFGMTGGWEKENFCLDILGH